MHMVAADQVSTPVKRSMLADDFPRAQSKPCGE
jgi:hypothetical protein